jgi:hypothetical protein
VDVVILALQPEQAGKSEQAPGKVVILPLDRRILGVGDAV